MLSASEEVIEVRRYNPEIDKPFIYSTWLKNYKQFSYFAKRIKHDIFFKEHHKILDHLLLKPSINIVIASPKDDLDTITGYLVYEISPYAIIHFIYVKDAFRKMGIAKLLLKTQRIDINDLRFTHWTYPIDELIKKYPMMIYNPYSL